MDITQYMEDSQGRLVPEELVSDADKARDELVSEMVGKAEEIRDILKEFKKESMEDVYAFVELAAEKYGAKIGGKKGNVTLWQRCRKKMRNDS